MARVVGRDEHGERGCLLRGDLSRYSGLLSIGLHWDILPLEVIRLNAFAEIQSAVRPVEIAYLQRGFGVRNEKHHGLIAAHNGRNTRL